ncbi:hypothetical protein ABPG75_000778 [Micractinium tetrahymenae]
MGMDCLPLNPRVDGFHANWTGWRFLRQALELLGADTSGMSSSNDGNVISRETAQDWSRRLQEGLDTGKLKIVQVPDDSFFGGYRNACSLTSGNPARQHGNAPWLREAIDFFERSGGFQQY